MSITTKIIYLGTADIQDLPHVVIRVTWQILANTNKFYEDNTPIQISVSGKSLLTAPDPNNFTEYNNLTEQQIITWLSTSVEYLDGLTKITKELAERNAPPTMLRPLPWSTTN
jgi:hypothetical protein